MFIGSAAAFPGGAVHGVPGDAAARAALKREPRGRSTPPSTASRRARAAPSTSTASPGPCSSAAAVGCCTCWAAKGMPAYQREGEIEIVRYMREAVARARARRGLRRAAARAARRAARRWRSRTSAIRGAGMPIVDHPGDFLPRLRGQRAAVDRAAVPVPGDPGRAARADRPRSSCAACGPPDLVITPSQVTADPAAGRSARGAQRRGRPAPARRPARRSTVPYLLYFGALQPWQGVDTALRAVARLPTSISCSARRCTSGARSRTASSPRSSASTAACTGTSRWCEEELAALARPRAAVAGAAAGLLRAMPHQGCAPLKILESMAAGVPVVASDLPAVRELVHGRRAWPARRARPAGRAGPRDPRPCSTSPSERAQMGARGPRPRRRPT